MKTPPNEHGALLVRDSDKEGYTLSMKDGDMVKDYKICTSLKLAVFHNNPSSTLFDLVQHV